MFDRRSTEKVIVSLLPCSDKLVISIELGGAGGIDGLVPDDDEEEEDDGVVLVTAKFENAAISFPLLSFKS